MFTLNGSEDDLVVWEKVLKKRLVLGDESSISLVHKEKPWRRSSWVLRDSESLGQLRS
jgi:hypothetical protein